MHDPTCTRQRTRIVAIAVAVVAAAAPFGPALAETPERALVLRAIAVSGGRAALERATTLRWAGEAVIATREGRLKVEVRSIVRPFRSARSESWPRAEGPAAKRVLEVSADGGWIEHDGRREPLSASAWQHERQQYAIYGLMRLLPLLDDGVILRRLPPRAGGRPGLHVEHPAAPPADLFFDAAGHLCAIEDRVVDPAGGPPIAQRIELGGAVPGAPIRWPRTLTILQNGAPFFALSIRRFSTGEDRGRPGT